MMTDSFEAPESPEELSPITVLVVDDDNALRTLIRAHLKQAGYQVRLATNGREALDSCRDHPPDLIILDVMMPVINGLEVLRELRLDETFAAIYILMLTANDRPDEMLEGFRLSADDYVPKPFRIAELMARVNAGARLVRMQMCLRASNASLNDALRQRNELLGLTMHDLRNPIHIISSYLTLLGESETDQELIKSVCLRRIRDMQTLIDNLANYTDVQAGRIQLRPRLFRLTPLLVQAANLMEPVARTKKMTLSVEGDESIRAYADELRTMQMINTILTAFLEAGEMASSITLTSHEDEETTGFEISIRPSCLPGPPHVAFCLPQDRTEVQQIDLSNRLGLALTQQLARNSGGDVIARVEEDTGVLGVILPRTSPESRKVDPSELMHPDL